MQPGVDEQYQCRLPNDVAELFYYCGRDEGFQAYVNKLVEPRRQLFEQWCRDPELLKRAGTDKPRQVMSFWISGQLHVTDYLAMRRQHWYSRFHGIDSILMWRLTPTDMVYAQRIGCNAVMGAGSQGAVLMTDRGLAWYDLYEDMALITLLRMLQEQASPARQRDVERLAQAAYEASQRCEFDLARHHLTRAIRLLNQPLADLFCPDFYRPVTAEPLPDLVEEDKKLEKPLPKRIVEVPKLQEGHRPPPTLDGVLDNCYLEEGATLGEFMLLDKNSPATEQTVVYLARDENCLYLLFKCSESQMDQLVATPDRARDQSPWEDDCVEVFIDRLRDGVSFDQFVVSASGAIYDGRTRKGGAADPPAWNPDWRVAVAREPNGWSAELSLPFAAYGGPPAPGEVWGLNCGREQKPRNELSTWSPAQEAFGIPGQFGEVKFP
jgi:hypothetical protein